MISYILKFQVPAKPERNCFFSTGSLVLPGAKYTTILKKSSKEFFKLKEYDLRKPEFQFYFGSMPFLSSFFSSFFFNVSLLTAVPLPGCAGF